jgi:hypothetical protein
MSWSRAFLRPDAVGFQACGAASILRDIDRDVRSLGHAIGGMIGPEQTGLVKYMRLKSRPQ